MYKELIALGKALSDAGPPDDVGPPPEVELAYYEAMDAVKQVARDAYEEHKKEWKEGVHKGLYNRYIVEKRSTQNIDPNAIYFVLRLDRFGDDEAWTKNCRGAARVLAAFMPTHLKEMGKDLEALINKIERDECPDCPAAGCGGARPCEDPKPE